MGTTKHCVFPNCNSDSRYHYKPHMENITFVAFPKLKSKPTYCHQWVSWLSKYKPGFSVNDVKYTTYLCSKHLGDDFFNSQLPVLRKHSPVISIFGPPISILKPACSNSTNHQDLSALDDAVLKPLGMNCNNHKETAALDIVATGMNPFAPPEMEHQEIIVPPEMDDQEIIVPPEMDDQEIIVPPEISVPGKQLSSTIIDFFSTYIFPRDWAVNISDSEMKLLKINNKTNGVIISITISSAFDFSLIILNVCVKEHPLLPNLPTTIANTGQLTEVLKNLETVHVCDGIQQDKYKEIFRLKTVPSGQFCWYTKSIRHKSCCLLSKLKTCIKCVNLRSYFRVQVFRQAKERKRIASFKSLTTTEMIEELKKRKSEGMKLKRKLTRKENKIREIVMKKGDKVGDKTEQWMTDILEKNLSKGFDETDSMKLKLKKCYSVKRH